MQSGPRSPSETRVAAAVAEVNGLIVVDLARALETADRLLDVLAECAPHTLRPLRAERMNVLRGLGRFEEAAQLAHALLVEDVPAGTDTTSARAYNMLAECALIDGRPADAVDAAERGLALVRGAGTADEAQLFSNRGRGASEQGDLPGAEKNLRAAHAVYRQLEHHSGQSVTLSNLGIVHSLAGRLDKAAECLERAGEVARRSQLNYAETLAEANLAEVLERLGRADEALAACRRVLELNAQQDRRALQHAVLIVGARLLCASGARDEARDWAQRALHAADAAAVEPARAEAYTELGDIELDAGDIDTAGELYGRGLRIARGLENPRSEARLLSGLLRVAGHRQEGFAVVSGVQEMLDAASRSVHDQSLLSELHRTASEVYEDMGEPARALEHLRAHLAIEKDISRPSSPPIDRSELTEVVRRELERLVAERDSELLATRAVLKETAADRDRMSREHGALAHQLKHAQKMEAVGRLAGGIAHDFNNVLTLVRGYGELLASDVRDPHKRDLLDEILRAAGRGADMTRQLLTFSRRQPNVPGQVDLAALLEGWRDPLERLLGGEITLVVRPVRGVPAHADRGELEQVLMNLVVNARDAMPDGGTLILESFHDAADELAGVRVTDTGHGIDPTVLERIFEPFFTTKPPDVGTGLGLSTVYGIVTRADGTVKVQSRLGQGTTFEVRLPIARGERATEQGEVSEPGGCGAGPYRILLVEDDDAVRDLVRSVLVQAGHVVEEATTGLEAVDSFHRLDGRFDLVVTDLVLPFLSGDELSKVLAEERPALRFLFTSGHPHHRKSRGGQEEFLPKPFSTSELLERIAQLMQPT